MGFRLSESHGGEEPTYPVISELTFFGSALIESIGNELDRKDAIFYLLSKPYDSLDNLIFQVEDLGI